MGLIKAGLTGWATQKSPGLWVHVGKLAVVQYAPTDDSYAVQLIERHVGSVKYDLVMAPLWSYESVVCKMVYLVLACFAGDGTINSDFKAGRHRSVAGRQDCSATETKLSGMGLASHLDELRSQIHKVQIACHSSRMRDAFSRRSEHARKIASSNLQQGAIKRKENATLAEGDPLGDDVVALLAGTSLDRVPADGAEHIALVGALVARLQGHVQNFPEQHRAVQPLGLLEPYLEALTEGQSMSTALAVQCLSETKVGTPIVLKWFLQTTKKLNLN
ncbi:hypothetical protein BGZ73_001449 [Actinomortierella ambigua]|nr:hypothetical protein BGZ73_001449 [Actinomortierella ambigua]